MHHAERIKPRDTRNLREVRRRIPRIAKLDEGFLALSGHKEVEALEIFLLLELGMRTFDHSLFELFNEGVISYEEAIRNADSANELRLNIKLNSTREMSTLSLEDPPAPEAASA